MTNSKQIQIFTDGACKGNPGKGGWGALLRYGDTEKQIFGGMVNTTNNRMEIQAVIEALNCLKKSPLEVKITTDSKYVKDGITKWIHGWKKRGWRTAKKEPVKNKDLWLQLEQAVSQHQVEWDWVKGHSGHRENEIADELANKGVLSV